MTLHDFTTRYLSIVRDFTEMLPLLVESEHTAAHLYTLGGRLYGASSQWLKIALQYAAEDAEVTDSMIQALKRAETILQHLRLTSLSQQSPESLRFSDLQFGQAVRDLTHEELKDLLNVLGHGDPGTFDETDITHTRFIGQDVPGDTEQPSRIQRMRTWLKQFKDKTRVQYLHEFKAILLTLFLSVLKDTGVAIPAGLPTEQIQELIDQTFSGLKSAKGEVNCYIDVKLEKITLSDDAVGIDGWVIELTIDNDYVRIPDQGYLTFTQENGHYEQTFHPPELVAEFVKDGCGVHLINMKMETVETESLGHADTDQRNFLIRHVCENEPQSEEISLHVREDEGSTDVDLRGKGAMITAHLRIESDCR